MKATLISSLSLLMVSCTFYKKEVIADFNGLELLEDDFIAFAEVEGFSVSNDEEREKFIKNWLIKQYVSSELARLNPKKFAENRFKSEQSLFQLNLFELENTYLDQLADSTVSEEEILSYYNENRNNYIQSSYIVKALYIKIPDSIPAIKNIERAFLLKNDKDRADIQKYGNLYASTFYLEEEKWIFLEDLVRDIPITEDKKEELVQSRGSAIFKDNSDTYFLNVMDYRVKKTNMPLDFERENIVKHIQKRRINEIRQETKNKIIADVKEKFGITDF